MTNPPLQFDWYPHIDAEKSIYEAFAYSPLDGQCYAHLACSGGFEAADSAYGGICTIHARWLKYDHIEDGGCHVGTACRSELAFLRDSWQRSEQLHFSGHRTLLPLAVYECFHEGDRPTHPDHPANSFRRQWARIGKAVRCLRMIEIDPQHWGECAADGFGKLVDDLPCVKAPDYIAAYLAEMKILGAEDAKTNRIALENAAARIAPEVQS